MTYISVIILYLLILVILLLSEGFLYSFGTALQSVSKEMLSGIKTEGSAEGLKELKARPQKFIDTIQCLSVVINVTVGAIYVPFFYGLFLNLFKAFPATVSSILSVALSFFLAVVIVLVFGVQLPKQMGNASQLKIINKRGKKVLGVVTVIKPLAALVTVLVKACLILFGIEYDSDLVNVTEDEILSMVSEGHKQGVLQDSEARMITNIFEYGDKQVRDVMTGRGNIDAISADESLIDVMQTVLSGHFSRFPVYTDDLDHIQGVIYLKDVCRMARNEKLADRPIGSVHGLVRKPVFIHEMKNVDDVMKLMQRTHMQMAVVIDEYGQTAGIVTLEDILEEIVGNIQDEYDPDDQYITREGKNQFVVDGQTPLDDIDHLLKIRFDTPGDIETVNGFVIYHLQHLPADGEKFLFVYKGWEFRILSSENMMVKKVRIRRHASFDNEVEDTAQKV
ncbi:MAG: hemolysin family protein [Lachnospiraceae bacterium]|nr:hemolysin family protein [Lachnospiraceae bacterium]